jgi:colanic acid/amylovoran biosynthesis protein
MITLMGAAPDTGNQGVSALCASAIDGLRQRGMTQIAVADHGRGRRVDSDGTQRFGLTHHRRLWRSDCLRVVHAMAPFGGGLSVSARTIAQSNAVLDVSGGDSFTDLYGPKRFGAMTLSKRAALRAGRPLILLPQTIGPFKGDTARKEATAILRRATAIWVRDARSEQILRDLLQDDYDPARHQRGPDMAVLLPAQKPANLPAEINDVLSKHTAAPLAGLNVSGLLCQQDDDARRQFGLADSHRHQSEAVARAVLDSDPTMRLVLVSHVQRPTGDMESDHDAAGFRSATAAIGDRAEMGHRPAGLVRRGPHARHDCRVFIRCPDTGPGIFR